jgi:hypothetical protein
LNGLNIKERDNFINKTFFSSKHQFRTHVWLRDALLMHIFLPSIVVEVKYGGLTQNFQSLKLKESSRKFWSKQKLLKLEGFIPGVYKFRGLTVKLRILDCIVCNHVSNHRLNFKY